MSWCWALGCLWRLLVLGWRVVGRWHRKLGIFGDGDSGGGMLALLVLWCLVSMADLIRRYSA